MLDNRHLKFYEYINEESLITNKYKIKEPDSTKCKEIIPDIIITPILCFDKNKYRLGYGKGYYDSTFVELENQDNKFITLGLAFDEQLIDGDLPIEAHDKRLDFIVTPSKFFI